MSTQQKLRGGTSLQHQSFTGAAREVTFDTDRFGLVTHDGLTPGGWPVPNFAEAQMRAFSSVVASGVGSGAIVLTLPVIPPSGVSTFLSLTFRANANSAGACTVNVNGTGAVALKKMGSGALADIAAGDLVANGIYTITFNGTVWILEGGPGGGGVQLLKQTFNSSGVWTKPAGLIAIEVELVGGGSYVTGGAPAYGSLASGAGYSKKLIQAADLASTVTVTVGAVGSDTTGGASSFGTHCSANGAVIGASGTYGCIAGGTASGGDLNLPGLASYRFLTGGTVSGSLANGIGIMFGASHLGTPGMSHLYSTGYSYYSPGGGPGCSSPNSYYWSATAGQVVVKHYIK